jgi:hypothetical protein
MRSVLIGLSCVASLASAAPFSFNGDALKNGFPNPNPSQLNDIEVAAHGSLPVAAPNAVSKPLAADSLVSQRFIAFNEIFEVAFFTSLINNITVDAPGFKIDNQTKKNDLLDDLKAIQAQEELHAINANKALTGNKQDPIQPCQYNFPTTTLDDAIALAATFTDLVLSTLPDLQTGFAAANDSGLIRPVGSVIGQEGQQDGFFRAYLKAKKLIPAQLPFLTAGTRQFAFSALNQMFVVAGSCPNLDLITKDITINAPLTVKTQGIQPKSQTVAFSFDVSGENAIKPEWKGHNNDWSGLSLAYVNQQNVPVIEPLQNVQVNIHGQVTISFEALFPFNGTTFGQGLTIAALVPSGGDLSTVVAVSGATIAGPGLIDIN